jgi:hypothetical protein
MPTRCPDAVRLKGEGNKSLQSTDNKGNCEFFGSSYDPFAALV